MGPITISFIFILIYSSSQLKNHVIALLLRIMIKNHESFQISILNWVAENLHAIACSATYDRTTIISLKSSL